MAMARSPGIVSVVDGPEESRILAREEACSALTFQTLELMRSLRAGATMRR